MGILKKLETSGPRKFNDIEVFKRHRKNYVSSINQSLGKLPSDHSANVGFKAYVTSGKYQSVHDHLRAKGDGKPVHVDLGDINFDLPGKIKATEEVMDNMPPTTKPFRTFRSMSADRLIPMLQAANERADNIDVSDPAALPDSLVGKKLKEHSFMSSAPAMIGATKGASGNVLLEVDVPIGAKAGHISYGMDGGGEVLFKPGQELQITEVNYKNDRLCIKCQLIPEDSGQT